MVITKHQNNKYTLNWPTVKSVIEMILTQVGSQNSLELLSVLRTNYTADDLIACKAFKVSPNAYRYKPRQYFEDVQISALINKLADVGLENNAEVRVLSTIESFQSRERENYFWNTHLFNVIDENPFINSVLKHARFFLHTLLDECSLPEFPDFEIGKGVTSSIRGEDNHIYAKFDERSLVSAKLYSFLKLSKGDDEFYASYFDLENPEIENFCDIATVPKDAFIDRIVTFDPFVNKTIQRFYGNWIRERLDATVYKKVNLRDRPAYHTSLMCDASLHKNKLCTIDVKNASNSIYTSLVFNLLKRDVFTMLDTARITRGYLPCGKVHEFEMFSSNGNGFTFELETAIFYAICLGVKKARNTNSFISVFGDDIIVSDDIFNDVMYVLPNIGLECNEKKTFGPSSFFRESCGSDYFHGLHVRPKFLKQFGDGILSLYRFHNAILKICDNLNIDDTAADFIINRIPKSLRFFGPEELGDGVLHSHNYTTCSYRVEENGVVCVYPYTKAVKQLVESTVKLHITDLDLRYSTIWRVMYNQSNQIADGYDSRLAKLRREIGNGFNQLHDLPTSNISSSTSTRRKTGKVKVVYTIVP